MLSGTSGLLKDTCNKYPNSGNGHCNSKTNKRNKTEKKQLKIRIQLKLSLKK